MGMMSEAMTWEKWYQDEAGPRDIGGGNGGLVYQERVLRAAAPLNKRTTIKT